MSEGIVIALIGFVGAVLGAAIAGFATITAAGMKGKGEGSISCGLIGLLASLGAAGGLVLGAVFGASLIQRNPMTGTQQPSYIPPTSSPQMLPTAIPRQPTSTYCYGQCWQYDHNARTMTWTGPADGTEDIWQPSGEALQKIRDGYTAIFSTSVHGEIFACVLTVNGQTVKNACDGVLYQVPPGTYRVTSANKSVGGFRWCPLIGYGWRINGGDCK